MVKEERAMKVKAKGCAPETLEGVQTPPIAEEGNKTPEGEKVVQKDADESKTGESNKPTSSNDGESKVTDEGKSGEGQHQVSTRVPVSLKGTESERTGNHTVHYDASTIVTFRNGIAEVSDDLADRLRDAGIVE
jgi:hypothetical protein